VEWTHEDALLIIASDIAVRKRSAVRINGRRGGVRWRGRHVALDEEQRKCTERSQEISVSIIYISPIAHGHITAIDRPIGPLDLRPRSLTVSGPLPATITITNHKPIQFSFSSVESNPIRSTACTLATPRPRDLLRTLRSCVVLTWDSRQCAPTAGISI